MTEQDDRPGAGVPGEDRGEVAAELVDGGVPDIAPAGPAVAALVVQHDTHPAAQRLALQHELLQAGGEAVHEHHGQRRAREIIDLDVQPGAVVGEDHVGADRPGGGPHQLAVPPPCQR